MLIHERNVHRKYQSSKHTYRQTDISVYKVVSLLKIGQVSIYPIYSGVCSALDYLHTEQLIMHADIKSANILIKRDFETGLNLVVKMQNVKYEAFNISLKLVKTDFTLEFMVF